jgi:hypothetical protein
MVHLSPGVGTLISSAVYWSPARFFSAPDSIYILDAAASMTTNGEICQKVFVEVVDLIPPRVPDPHWRC